MFECISALILLLGILYKFLTWHFDYWEKQGVKGDKPTPLIGTFKPLWHKNQRLEEQDLAGYTKHGRVFGGFEGREPVLTVGDPELLKSILVKDFSNFTDRRVVDSMTKIKIIGKILIFLKGEEWKTVRNIITPTFSTGKLKLMIYLIEECVDTMNNEFKKLSDKNEPVEFKNYFSAFMLDIIASCTFGMKLNCIENPNNDFIKNARKVLENKPLPVYLLVVFPWLFSFVRHFLPMEHFEFFEKIVNQAIKTRREEKNQTRRDLLNLMLEAADETNSDVFTHDTIISQAILFLMAGQESPSTTLSFAAYLLATHPSVQERLVQEIDDVVNENEGKITYDIIGKVEYLDMVILETLRLYPPSIRLDRVCKQDNYNLQGITLKKNMTVIVPILSIHRDKEFYPEPEKFDPERFSPENKPNLNPLTYLAFGSGPRNCVAKRFALIVIKLALANILFQYNFRTCEQTEIPLAIGGGPGIMTPVTVTLKLEKRLKMEFS